LDELDDGRLAERAAAGDRAAFALLAERHYDRVHALAWRWTGDRNSAEDIAQDVMIKIAKAIATFRGECAFRTWVYRIAYTTAMDHRRASRVVFALAPAEMDALLDGDNGRTPEQDAMDCDLWRAVRALPDQQRDAVLLIYAEDLSHAEAAQVMGCSEKTVSWHVHEARKRLKVKLGAAG
jgi:RNA polymerase sigma-70 factor, ECF subfamily